jgi:ADP-heptose:LPS heptosyltransferase
MPLSLRTLLQSLRGPKHNSPVSPGAPERVTLIRSDRFGDHMIFGGFLEILREAWPRTHFTLVLPKERAPLYEECPLVNELVFFDARAVDGSRQARAELYERVRAARPDYLINSQCMPCETAERIIRYCPARVRLGITARGPMIDAKRRRRYDRFYTHLVDLGEFQPWRSEKLLYRDLLALLGIPFRNFVPRIWTSADDVAYAERIYAESGFVPEQTLVYFCGSSHKLRTYPPLKQLMERLLHEGPWTVLAVGGKDEFDFGEPSAEDLRAHWRNLCGLNTIRQSAELMRKCRLVLGVESGLAQAAAAVGAPHVILQSGTYFGRFLPTSPRTSVAIQPLECYFCAERCIFDEAYCLSRIPPEVFYYAVREALAGPAAKSRIYVAKNPGPVGEARPAPFRAEWIDSELVSVIEV